MVDQTKREKLLSRLKKCMALSASPEPHEAAAAMRHAQALMKELGITEADLEALEIHDALIKTREGFGACRVVSHLITIVRNAFGVDAIQERNPGSANRLNVRYIGPRDRVIMAEYAHQVVWRAMMASWEEHLRLRPHLKGQAGRRQAFCIGWLAAVHSKVQALAPTESEASAIGKWIDKKYGTALSTVEHKPKSLNASDYSAGKNAAGDFQLHRPVGESLLGIEHKK